MKRSKEFLDSVPKPITISDSRFGLRKMFLNPKERSRVVKYATPGRGPNGEHQN